MSQKHSTHSIFSLSTWALVAGSLLTGIFVSVLLHVTKQNSIADLDGVQASIVTAKIYGISIGIFGLLGLLLLWLRLDKMSRREQSLVKIATHATRGQIDDALNLLSAQRIHDAALRDALDTARNDAVERVTEHSRHKTDLQHMSKKVFTIFDTLEEQTSVSQKLSNYLHQDGEIFEGLASYVEGLSRSADESSSSILQMVTSNNEVRESVHHLALSVQETSSAIEEMTFSSKEVAKNIEELSTAAEETAASMNQMDVSISQVEGNANETSRLSETVSKDAETGVAAIQQTIEGIDKIKESSRFAAEVIGNLGERILQIGNILNVIDDVAEQTNLLALNAAIIAAQAGEHGRGFAVVADEIKALAERTGASTKEIADLVKTIQDQSQRAINVMAQGVGNVEEGVRLGHNAEDALTKIVESAKRSTLMIHAIAQATVEQAKGSKQVTNAISRIAETSQQIAYATAEQAKGTEHIMQSAERMRGITQQVERSADEQTRGGRQITQAIESIREIAESMEKTQKNSHLENVERAQAAGKMIDISVRSVKVFKDLKESIAHTAHEFETKLSMHKRLG